MSDPAHTPVDIDVQRERAMRITFEDGAVAEYPVAALRAACPCATCRGMRERGREAWPPAAGSAEIAIRGAELSGAWGLSIDWSDGHSTGIYAWSTLRRWWDAGLETAMVPDRVREAD